jgi:hypothetical protein
VADFVELRRLADLMGGLEARATLAQQRSLALLVKKLGATCVPLLGRALRSNIAPRLEAARDAFASLAASSDALRVRVIAELHAITVARPPTRSVCARLARGARRARRRALHRSVRDPAALGAALAAQLEAPNDVANAADMMVHKLDDGDVVQMLGAHRGRAVRGATTRRRVALRLDIAPWRARIAAASIGAPASVGGAIATPLPAAPDDSQRVRPTHVAVLVDSTARIVVVATRKVNGERRWRRWAVLIGDSGCIDDCLHEDAHSPSSDPTASLIANLCADGYRVASNELDHARTLVATAARARCAPVP